MKLKSLMFEKKPKIMIIPMIDIIFFLLVFFMMSMLTMVSQKSIDLNLPKASTSQMEQTSNLPIAIDSEGTIYVKKQKIEKSDFRARMEIAKKVNPNLSVIIRADERSKHKNFVFVIDELKSIGIEKIGIAVDSSENKS